MSIHSFIRQRRLALGLSQQDLADRIGVTRGTIQHWEREGGTAPKRNNWDAAAAALQVSVADLLAAGMSPDATDNAGPAMIGTTRIPVISEVQAGDYTAIMDAYEPGGASEYLLTDIPVSKNTFALQIRGQSMEPEFKEGDRVIIDPAVKPQPGDYVAAKRVDGADHSATFKKYRPRGLNDDGHEVFELVPLNEDYPSMRNDKVEIEIIGTMIEHRRYRRSR